ncbi:ciliary microtubule associated protein 1A-like [Podargus strigoides]
MPDNGWVGSWRPHRPRGPVAALFKSPGPKYGLPSNVGYNLHDPSRNRAPAYSFGLRRDGQEKQRSPGPRYLLPPGTTVKGKAGTPAFSICGRPRDMKPFCTPGPGHYSPEKAERATFPSAPACSLRSRTRHCASQQTPGPAAYKLPPMLGPRVITKSSAPNYSMPGRSNVGTFNQDLCKTPGPGNYNPVSTNVYKQRAPQYSIPTRNAILRDTTIKPSPNAYYPQQRRQRGVTFGIRHSEYLAPLIVDVPND